MRCQVTLGCLLITASLTAGVHAHPAVEIYPSLRTLARRQDTPSSTYDYWWPYPAWGASSTVAAAGSPTPPPIPVDPAAPALTSLATNLAALTSTAAGTPSLPLSTSTATMTFDGNMVRITALPPVSKPGQRISKLKTSSFNDAYLAPIFAFIGAVLGMLSAWLCLFLLRKRRTPHHRPFRPGPRYTAPTYTNENSSTAAGADAMESSESHFLGQTTPDLERRPTPDKPTATNPNWLMRQFSTHRRESASHQADVQDNFASANDSMMGGEDDPFLVVPTDTPHSDYRPGRTPSIRAKVIRTPRKPSDDEEPYATIGANSIRPSIIDRLKHGSRYRKGHKKADSDFTVPEARPENIDSLDPAGPPGPRTPRTPRTPDCRGGTAKEPQGDLGQAQRGSMLAGWKLPWTTSPEKLPASDTYTALPTSSRSPDKRGELTPKPGIPRIDSSVLPSSPPLLSSPPLHAQLFLSVKSSPALDLSIHDFTSLAATNDRGGRAAEGGDEKARNKLHTQRPPPGLPFPSSPEYQKRSRNVLSKAGNSPSSSASLTASPESRSRSPAERHLQRHTALNKVDEIVARSWSARDMRGEQRLASPTMFGAIPEDEKCVEDGIEQRLLQTTIV